MAITTADARRIIMGITQVAMREYDAAHKDEPLDINARLSFINGYITAQVPPEIRKLAV